MMKSSKPTYNVVLIDDSTADHFLFTEMLNQSSTADFILHQYQSIDAFTKEAERLSELDIDVVLLDFSIERRQPPLMISDVNNVLPSCPIVSIVEVFREEDSSLFGDHSVMAIIEKKGMTTSTLVTTLIHTIALFESLKERYTRGSYDYLTGLVNRGLLQERATHAIDLSRRNNAVVALILIDVDDFKKINDGYGHDAGDIFLKSIAKRLTDCVRSTDTVARTGGDEFAILLEGLEYPEQTVQIVKDILQSMQAPLTIKGKKVNTYISIGLSILYGKNIERFNYGWLYESADKALYESKDKGKNTYSIFTEKHDVEMINALQLEDELTTAIQQKDFSLFYQPIFDVESNTLVGAEALLRWERKDGKTLSPNSFLPVVEKLGMMKELGDFVIDQAIMDIASWKPFGVEGLTIHINVAPAQFLNAGFYEHLKEKLEQYNVPPSMIELELTEQNLFENSVYIEREFVKLDWLGVRLAIDDFGTGYNSYGYLRRFKFNSLKIDKGFVQSIFNSEIDMAIVLSLTKFAQNLNINVIAEGVETKAQMDFLVELGVNQVQGYFKSAPIKTAAFEDVYLRQLAYDDVKVLNVQSAN